MPACMNVVITGACGGLGQALAKRYLESGARVALIGLDRAMLENLASPCPERARVYVTDVTDQQAMQATAHDWMAQAGVPDIVIANAGVAGGYATEEAADLAVFRRMLDINLLGPAITFQPFMRGMLERHAGTLVGIASIAGWRGMPGNGAYCASKGGLIRYLESLRAEMRTSGIRVLTVCPGYIRTPLTEGNPFPMPFLLDADVAAVHIIQAIAGRREHCVLPRQLGWLARLLACLPASWHDRILLRQPRKPRAGQAGASPIPGLPTHEKPSGEAGSTGTGKP